MLSLGALGGAMIRRYRIPTQRNYLSRIVYSQSFAVAVFAAIVIATVLANLEKFA